MIRNDDLARFWSKTTRIGECVVWTAAVDKDGYGKFTFWADGRQHTVRAHRWIYELFFGSPGDLLVLHSCDRPGCVNPWHLSAGTQLVNVHDALDRRRRPRALSTTQIDELRNAKRNGRSIRATAAALGVNYFTAWRAAVGLTWKTT